MEVNSAKRIVVVGISASGKTSFASLLAKRMNLPLFHMDSIMWKPGWEYVGDEKTIERLDEISRGDNWVIEGYVTKEARTFLFDRADLIVHLNYSRFVGLWRYLKRWWKHRNIPRPEMEGSPERFSFKFLWLVWTKGEDVSLKGFLENVSNRSKILMINHPNDAKKLINSL